MTPQSLTSRPHSSARFKTGPTTRPAVQVTGSRSNLPVTWELAVDPSAVGGFSGGQGRTAAATSSFASGRRQRPRGRLTDVRPSAPLS